MWSFEAASEDGFGKLEKESKSLEWNLSPDSDARQQLGSRVCYADKKI